MSGSIGLFKNIFESSAFIPCCSTVPCMRRAKDLEAYDPKSEYALSGEEDGWVATHSDPHAATEGAEHVPNMDADDEAGGTGGKEDEDIPDISELEIQAEEDEVSRVSFAHESRSCLPLWLTIQS